MAPTTAIVQVEDTEYIAEQVRMGGKTPERSDSDADQSKTPFTNAQRNAQHVVTSVKMEGARRIGSLGSVVVLVYVMWVRHRSLHHCDATIFS